jgi:hypothetical protein
MAAVARFDAIPREDLPRDFYVIAPHEPVCAQVSSETGTMSRDCDKDKTACMAGLKSRAEPGDSVSLRDVHGAFVLYYYTVNNLLQT